MSKTVELVTGEYYHIFNKSIAGYRIFNNNEEYLRMLRMIRYYQFEEVPCSFGQFIRLEKVQNMGFDYSLSCISDPKNKLMDIIAYCFMPTHVHFILKQLMDDGISTFMSNILNSYARFFNTKYKRKGPLWVGRFGRVLVDSEGYLLHLSRYVHLNPTTANLAKTPEDWVYSSYNEYLHLIDTREAFCNYQAVIEIEPSEYKEFVEDRIGYQKEMAHIKHLLLE